MDFFELVKTRCSMRVFAPTPLEDDKVQRILQSINLAPSAGNLQAYEVYLVTRPEDRAALMQAAWDQAFVAQAPLVLVFCTNAARSAVKYRQRGADLYCLQDATIACTYAMLAAAGLGLGSVWVGAFDEEAVWRAIGSPEGHRPVAVLPIGYPGRAPRYRPRPDLGARGPPHGPGRPRGPPPRALLPRQNLLESGILHGKPFGRLYVPIFRAGTSLYR